jgi:hypothetical protein
MQGKEKKISKVISVVNLASPIIKDNLVKGV